MDKYYVMISPVSIFTANNTQEAYNRLYYWPFPYCEAFSVKTSEEAGTLARQIYYARFFVRPEFLGRQPMSVPTTCPIALLDPRAPMEQIPSPLSMVPTLNMPMGVPQSNLPSLVGAAQGSVAQETSFDQPGPLVHMGVWSVSYEGGFAVENVLEKLVYLLEDKKNPHAMWWPNAEIASCWARKDYIDRFIRFYDLRDIDILLPERMLEPGQEYNDPRFENGGMEIPENMALKNLREGGFL